MHGFFWKCLVKLENLHIEEASNNAEKVRVRWITQMFGTAGFGLAHKFTNVARAHGYRVVDPATRSQILRARAAQQQLGDSNTTKRHISVGEGIQHVV